MGRYDFRPLRVRQTAKALFDTKRNDALPQWYQVLGDIPPSEALSRPVQRTPRVRGMRKPSKMFQPLPIAYPEDKLRSEFFGDHPWELARPRLVVEDSGNDAKAFDWSKIVQAGKQLDGESVIQHQLWLMKNKSYSKLRAYDQARSEFYHHRHLEDVRRRVAKEEALHVGAYFGKGPLEVGMELEDKAWESWKRWAERQIDEEQSMRAQMFSGPQEGDEAAVDQYEDPLDELAVSEPAALQGPPGRI
ncbi:37S ribosomal protein Rsm25 [Amniculicola lignicola CBS 123094]|uniref:37S ribosomal protein S25, mitochondrial n=1 Tax=Amniculicola lignicola CBS 123094 TaxID=1392246 RepID=A0A6A5X247_9PLEO|nr:37S ribosomal protein Rsm25 [Amniculicola lignicola CBS 123094]